jgi:hypothetical protein
VTIELTLLSAVAHRGREITAPRLVDGLWPDEQPENPTKALQVLVSRARRLLGAEVIAGTPTGYRLDGLPLAVELAAARVRVMSVAEITRRLEDRFALLRGRRRDAPERHRTLHAVVDWSWNLLDEAGRSALRTLAEKVARVLGRQAPGALGQQLGLRIGQVGAADRRAAPDQACLGERGLHLLVPGHQPYGGGQARQDDVTEAGAGAEAGTGADGVLDEFRGEVHGGQGNGLFVGGKGRWCVRVMPQSVREAGFSAASLRFQRGGRTVTARGGT